MISLSDFFWCTLDNRFWHFRNHSTKYLVAQIFTFFGSLVAHCCWLYLFLLCFLMPLLMLCAVIVDVNCLLLFALASRVTLWPWTHFLARKNRNARKIARMKLNRMLVVTFQLLFSMPSFPICRFISFFIITSFATSRVAIEETTVN